MKSYSLANAPAQVIHAVYVYCMQSILSIHYASIFMHITAEGYAARVTFKQAKEEGMQVAVHWQDADSSSAKAVTEVFPDAEIMVCGGHAGRAHKKILELRQKIRKFPQRMINKYKNDFPAVCKLECKCKGHHSANCGSITIAKAHTNFTSILWKLSHKMNL